MSNKPVKNTRLSPATEEDKIKFLEEKKRISLDGNLEGTRGIYGFFAINGTEEICCFYVGKANNIYNRMIVKGRAHLYDYYSICNDGNVKRRDVHDLLDKYLDAGYSIEVRIIKEVPYNEKESTQYNANQLVFEEIKALLDFQKKGQCPDQYHEAVKPDEKNYLEKTYPKNRDDRHAQQ